MDHYMSKQLEDLRKQYQAVASKPSAFMVSQGKWGTCDESSPGLKMPTYLLSEGEVDDKFVRVPMSQKCCDHMDAVLASQADLKSSKASVLVRVWLCHFQHYCRFRTSMTDERHTVWSKDEQQMLQVVNKDAAHKASIAPSVAQVQLAEDAIKNGTVVETMLGVIDTATFVAKADLDECIHHLLSAQSIDRQWLLEMLRTLQDRVQLASASNTFNRNS